MTPVVTKGLILQSFDYEETSKIVTVLTENYGLVTLIAPGVNKITSKNRYSLTTFTFGEYIFFPARYKNRLSKLKTGHFINDNLTISESYNNYLYACSISQIIQMTQESWEFNREIFWDLNLALSNFNSDQQPLSNFVRFLFYYLPLFGGPALNYNCVRCARRFPNYQLFSLSDLGWVCFNCQDVSEINQETEWLNFIKKLEANTFQSSQNEYLETEYFLILGKALLDYYQNILGITNTALKLVSEKPMFKNLVQEIYTNSVLTTIRKNK